MGLHNGLSRARIGRLSNVDDGKFFGGCDADSFHGTISVVRFVIVETDWRSGYRRL